MTQTDLILLNLNEIRRKSIKLWKALPESHYNWKPDENAMTASEMIQHVLGADYGWNIIINNGDMSNYKSPWENRVFTNLTDELAFAEPFRAAFLNSIKRFTNDELSHSTVTHPGNGEQKNLAQYLLRIGYHESVHAGHFLSYLRGMKLDRPEIWD